MAKFRIEYDTVRISKEEVFFCEIEADDPDHARRIFAGLGPSNPKKIGDIFGGTTTRYDVRQIKKVSP